MRATAKSGAGQLIHRHRTTIFPPELRTDESPDTSSWRRTTGLGAILQRLRLRLT
jgi:hypothetical protein